MSDYKTQVRFGAHFLCAAGFLLLTGLATAQTHMLTVGEEPSCDFNDLQAAIDFVASENLTVSVPIRVNRNVEIANPPLVVRGALISLEGGYFDCDSDARAGTTDLSARSENRVFVVADALTDPERSSQLILRDIQVLGGRAFNGAGIQISGGSDVILQDSNVIDNAATLRGGGIEVLEGSTLLVLDGSRIAANLAGRSGRSGMGAGIYCEAGGDGARSMVNLIGDVEISGNQAIRLDVDQRARGGGLYLSGCDLDMFGDVKVLSNRATDGGGASLDHESEMQLLLDAERETAPRFEDNRVTGEGGALFVLRRSHVLMQRAAFIDNRATNGSGNGTGGALALKQNSTFSHGPSLTSDRRDVPIGCPHAPLCSRFVGNQADQRSLASVVGESLLSLHGALIAENSATDGSLVGVASFRPQISLVGNLIVHNSVARILSNTVQNDPRSLNEAGIAFKHNTIADNPGLQSVLHLVEEENTNRLLHVSNNLLVEDNVPILTGSSQFQEETWRCHTGSSEQSQPFDRQNIIDGPDFVDPSNLDYHLGPDSEAIDVCHDDGTELDIDGESRSVDHPSRPGDFHTDAGADEVQVLVDDLFTDRFEQQDVQTNNAGVSRIQKAKKAGR